MNKQSIHQVLQNVIAWSTAAAKEHVDICRHAGEMPDSETSMGLWQSFQAAFPKAGHNETDRDLLVTVYVATYGSVVKMLAPEIRGA